VYLFESDGVALETEQYDFRVVADRTRLMRAFNNLVRNAIESKQDGQAEVTVSLKAKDDEVHVDVTDNGSGIDPSRLPHIFEPKITTKTHGLGLGLAMVSAIVRDAGGSVSVLKTSHQGTTFRVSLPQYAKG